MVWVATCVLQVVWLVRLARLKLAKKYAALSSYLLVATALSIAAYVCLQLLPSWTANDSSILPAYKFYGWLWVVSQPLMWTLSFCIIVEVYNRILEDFKGLQRLGYFAMYAALGGVGCIYLAMIFLDASAAWWRGFWIVQERAVYVGLTVLSLLLLSFAWFFNLRVPRNARVVFGAFGFVFAIQAGFVVLLLASGGKEALLNGMPATDALRDLEMLRLAVMPIVAVVSMLAGTVLFSSGESEMALARPSLSRESEALMSEGLQGFNDVLLKVLRS
jgi:hypothetical protein